MVVLVVARMSLKRANTMLVNTNKRFCAIPAHFCGTVTPDHKMTSCGECKLLRIVDSIRLFVKNAVEEHNRECIRLMDVYVAKEVSMAKEARVEEAFEHGEIVTVDDVDDYDLDLDGILADYVPDYKSANMETLEALFDELGVECDFEYSESDGMIEEAAILDFVDSIEYQDWVSTDMHELLRSFDIPVAPRRISFTAGNGIRLHARTTGHDIALGKSV